MNSKPINPALDPAVIDRYLAGEASSGDIASVEAWILADAKHAELVQQMRDVQPGLYENVAEPDIDTAIRRVGAVVQVNEPKSTTRRISSRVFPSLDTTNDVNRGVYSLGILPRWVGYAAVNVAAALMIVAVGIKYLPNVFTTQRVSTTNTRTYITANGQHGRITLRDGSTVQLAPGSTLSADVTDANRSMVLTGEALFVVASNSRAPFIVHAGGTITRVLGTSFGVRSYPGEPAVQVVVAEGKVALGNTILTIGDVGEAHSDQRVDVRSNSNVAELLGWTSGHLTIRGVPMRDVIPILKRWYDIDVRLADKSLMDVPFTTTMSTTAQPVTVIEVLAATLDVRAEQDGRVVKLYRKRS